MAPKDVSVNGSTFETQASDAPIACDASESSENNGRDRIIELGRYRRFLRVQAMGMAPRLRSKVEPSDIVQQTMLDAHEKLDQFRGQSEGEMAKWLSQMLANNIADAARAWYRQKRDVRREQPLDRQSGSTVGGNDWIPSEQTSPSLCVHRAEQIMQVADAIQDLPTAQQQVIVLHHLHGLSLNEIAQRIDRSPSAVAGLIYRGLKSLRNVLES